MTDPKHRREDGAAQAIEGRRRILITGSREWPNQPAVAAAILKAWTDMGKPPVTVIHGGARGVDTMAGDLITKQAALSPFFRVEVHPALWDVHGKAAGFIRNAEMVSLGADLCLAFIYNNSKGATHTLELAEGAGIPCVVYRVDESGVVKMEA